MRKQLLKLATIERMMRPVAVAVVAGGRIVMIALASDLVFKNKSYFAATVVVMVWHNGVQKNHAIGRQEHYYRR